MHGTHADERDSIWLALPEFAIVAGLFVADVYPHIGFSARLPASSSGMDLVSFAWTALERCWVRAARSWAAAVGLGILGGRCIEGIELFVTQPLLIRMITKMPDLSDFTAVQGNLKLTLIYLLLTWTLAAFGEKMVYRGYLMNRVAGVFRGTRVSWIGSLVAVSVVFGCPHTGPRQHGDGREHMGRTSAWGFVSGLRAQPGGADHRAWGYGYG